jgi:hypothetical protein
MQIEIRASDRLRGKSAVDPAPVWTALSEALRESSIDLAKLRIVMDWLQYRENFREVVSAREIMPSALGRSLRINGESSDGNDCALEVGIDLRRVGGADLSSLLAAAFNREAPPPRGRVYLEDWLAGSESCIWAFNGLYWNALGLWEEATGREYEQALPGGETDARNTAAARTLIEELFKVWGDLAARNALPEDLYVAEIGVGNGNQAKVWLDEFVKLDRERGTDYYRRLHYLMGDYSPHVLERARDNVREHSDHTSALVMDARTPSSTLGFLRSKAFLIYISNVYDNLPTDEIVRIGGQLYSVEVRAYIAAEDVEKISAEFGIRADNLGEQVHRLLGLGPELLARSAQDLFPRGPLQAVEFWRAAWSAMRLEERFVPIEELDTYRVAPGISGEILRPIVEANGDVRMQLSNGAVSSFLDSLPLLHPFGVLQCHDLFATSIEQYETGFRGPGKYDGSVVNWVNGLILATVARRRGFEPSFERFAHRSGSNIVTLTARVRE